jgi:hypothetical protein
MADIFDEIIVHRGRNHPMAAMHNAAHNWIGMHNGITPAEYKYNIMMNRDGLG